MSTSPTNEATRCLKCHNPLCQKGCPAATDIPSVIKLYTEGKIDDAGALLFDNNPLSLICGMVCDHAKQCEGHCILNRKGNPIHFGIIEQEISSLYIKNNLKLPLPRNQQIAIIGAGAAGLTASLIFAQSGYAVTLFESEAKIGGTMQYGIPAFRLPKSILEQYQQHLDSLGVKVRFNSPVDPSLLTIGEMQRDGYAAILITTGLKKPFKLDIKGETLPHVHYGLHYLKKPSSFNLGQKVVVIGAGSAAIDVARTALAQGSKDVAMYVRSAEENLHCDRAELAEALHEGVSIYFGHPPVEIVPEGIIFNHVELPSKALIEQKMVACDAVMIAISQGPDKMVDSRIKTNEKGLIMVNELGETSLPNVFAYGDNVLGAKTVVHAMQAAKEGARAIMERLK